MGIRVRVKIVAGGKSATTSALVNSGFESIEPDLCIPLGLAKFFSFWPPRELYGEEVVTAGGETTIYLVPIQAKIQLLAGDEVICETPCSLVVKPHIDEVLLSDYLIDELGIVAISYRKGLWRHRTDDPSTVRRSEEPQYW